MAYVDISYDLINEHFLNQEADAIWVTECECDGSAESATERLVDIVAEELSSYLPLEVKDREEKLKVIEIMASEIVKYWVKNFERYEAQSGPSALEEAEADIRRETMRNL